MAKAEVGHRSGAPERHCIGGRYARRERDERPGRGDRLLGVAAAQAGERPHAPTHPRPVDAIADRGHDAGYLTAGDVTFGEAVGGESTASDDDVDAADADRLGSDQYLTFRGTWVRGAMTARPSGLPNAWIATAFNIVSVLWAWPGPVTRHGR